MVSVVVGGAFVVDVFVEGLGEAYHGFPFEDAAAVRVVWVLPQKR